MSMLFKRIKDWAVSITSFRTGDMLTVDGPSGTAKIGYSDLAKEVIKDSANNTAATESDLVAGSTLPIMTADGPKALPGDAIAKASEQTALTTYAQNVSHSIAPEFDPTRNYVVDESCTYEGTVYIFTSNHPAGAWNPAHATISGQKALLRLTAQNAKSKFYDEVYNNIGLQQGSFKWSSSSHYGEEADSATRVRTGFIATPCYIKVADGYMVRNVIYYDADKGYASYDDYININKAYASDANAFVRFEICKTDATANIAPDEPIVSYFGREAESGIYCVGVGMSAAGVGATNAGDAYYDIVNNVVKVLKGSSGEITIDCHPGMPVNVAGSMYYFDGSTLCKSDVDGSVVKLVSIADSYASSGIGMTKGAAYFDTTTNKVREYVGQANNLARFLEQDPSESALYLVNGVSYLWNGTEMVSAGDFSQKKHWKILVLGNSYAADSWMYVPYILLKYGITCEIKMYYRGALSLRDLVNRWESTDATDTETDGIHAGTYLRYLYYIDTRRGSSERWHILERQSAKSCVAEGGWDIISIQQASVHTVDINNYNPYGPMVFELIRREMDSPYVLAWCHAYTRHSVDDIVENMDVDKTWYNGVNPFDMLIPIGTAVFNARTNAGLAEIGDSPYHNLWCSDNVHLQEGLPKYIAALTIIEAFFRKFGYAYSVLGETSRVTYDVARSWSTVERRNDSVGVTDINCWMAQECAIQAVRYPDEVKTIPDVPTGFSIPYDL